MSVLIVVRNHAPEPDYFCLCCNEASFVKGEERAYEQHVIRCSGAHDEAMRAESLRARMPGFFDPEVAGDVEFERWVRANSGALLEGRMRM